jgi:hypothetical protein
MVIDEIREKIAEKIQNRNEWTQNLDNSFPGHYGIHEWEVEISLNNIYVDIPSRTFTFKDVKYSFELQLMSSNDYDGIKDDFSKNAKGSGTFEFSNNGQDITIKDIEVEFDLELYPHQ